MRREADTVDTLASAVAMAPSKDPNRLKVGTLTYTTAGLIALFAWMLWGDFCYYLHEEVVTRVMPLVFEKHSVPKALMGLLMMSMSAALNLTLNPIISTASDRTRTRFGRRLPFLMLSAPINGLCLILLGFSENIGLAVARLGHWAPASCIIVVLILAFVMFRITDLFVQTVYFYLFNDVVPKAFISRFMSLFRIVGTLAAAGFNFFFFKGAEHHMREIFVGAGILYLIGYTLMCLKVKEGAYPPPPADMPRGTSFISKMRVFAKECFFHRFYWFLFLTNAATSTAGATAFLTVFLYRNTLGLTDDQIGKIVGSVALLPALLMYPAGILADRIHPLRVMRMLLNVQCVWTFTSLIWIFWSPSPHTALITVICLMTVAVPLSSIYAMLMLPMFMRVLPKDRFGQFCAANAMVICLVAMINGVAAGGFADVMLWVGRKYHHSATYGYRLVPLWSVAFYQVAGFFMYMLYREWKKLGGLKNYQPPNPELSDADIRKIEEARARSVA